jgi:DNA invertase Pin-like site-specific DNA recombinase
MRIVAYIRVSTTQQGRSGLGLEAQIAAVTSYAEQTGAEIIETYREIESGRKNDRPELAKALARARKTKATLVISKLDRLGRDAASLLQLQASPVKIVIADQPHIDKMMFGILAVFAESESDAISKRTKAALAAAKARGVKLGNKPGADLSRARDARSAAARSHADNVAAIITSIEKSGITTLAGIAKALEARGVKTPSGNDNWLPIQVSRIKQRAA